MQNLEKIIKISSEQLGKKIDESTAISQLSNFKLNSNLTSEWGTLLSQKNGFFAFESALHFYHLGKTADEKNSILWINDIHTWKSHYKTEKVENMICFAQDAFGNQFSIKENQIFLWDCEIGEFELIGTSFGEFFNILLEDYNYFTGYSVMHDWQMQNGALILGNRLVPKKPFFVGGEFSVDNLMSMDYIRSLHLRGEIFNQVKDLPDGSKISFTITD